MKPKPFELQHDDHIWLTILGESWAIQQIDRHGDTMHLHLWRGYEPNLEFNSFVLSHWDWDAYCDAAVALLEMRYGGK